MFKAINFNDFNDILYIAYSKKKKLTLISAGAEHKSC